MPEIHIKRLQLRVQTASPELVQAALAGLQPALREALASATGESMSAGATSRAVRFDQPPTAPALAHSIANRVAGEIRLRANLR